MRIAIVSPFVDRSHGTERAVAELVERLALVYGCEVHLFAQRVADVKFVEVHSAAGTAGGSIRWHRVPVIPGPQILRFGAWLALNRLWRIGHAFDLVVSPGINCLDADVVVVHVLFHQLAEISRSAGSDVASAGILRKFHRRIYYLLLSALERKIYGDRGVFLAAVSNRTASMMERHFHREGVQVVEHGVDPALFSPASRLARRELSRSKRGLQAHELALLLIGNDWATKGIHTIFEAMAFLKKLPLRLIVAGADARERFITAARKLEVLERCLWNGPTEDILDCYAAADVYVSPSREDSYGLPVVEAMACGLPAITSVSAGVSELVTDGANGFVLQDPRDAQALAGHIARLWEDLPFRSAMGEAAALAARNWTWDAHAAKVWRLLAEAYSKKTRK